MYILAIESSCDDTSVALVKADKGGFEIIKELTASQIEIHKKYGGVVPEIAGRMHAEKILPLIEEVLSDTNKKTLVHPGNPGNPCSMKDKKHTDYHDRQDLPGLRPDVICVTSGPGLITGLLVGVEAAKTLSYLWKIPLVGVNHIEGHICSPFIPNSRHESEESFEEKKYKSTTDIDRLKNSGSERSLVVPPRDEPVYPALALIASGGHTELILMKKQGQYKKIGATLDDAAGECFDKVAKLLGFEYPGGPKISLHAQTGNPQAIKFPRPMLKDNNFNFSFAGLKTSALYWLRNNCLSSSSFQEEVALRAGGVAEARANSGKLPLPPLGKRGTTLNDFCASFEQAIIDVLVGKTLKAAQKFQPKTIIFGGGVAANKKLRETLSNEIKNIIPYSLFLTPSLKYCMDNAVMIAIAGYYKAKNKKFTKWNKLIADPNWEIS